MNEKLSAFLDDETTRDETDSVVNALLRDETLRDSWSRQHWIRTTLHAHEAETAVPVDVGFSKRVMAAIDADDQSTNSASEHDKVVSMQRSHRGRRWRRGVAGMAAAASVAGVVLLTGNPFVRSGGNAESRLATTSSSATTVNRTQGTKATRSRSDTFAGNFNSRLADFNSISSQPTRAHTVATNATAGGQPADQWTVSDPAVRDELNGYLADHNGMARGYGMYSTTPALVRVAAYGQGVTQ